MSEIVMIGSEALRADGIEVNRPKFDADFISTVAAKDSLVAAYIRSGVFGRVREIVPTRTGVAYKFDQKVLEFELVGVSDMHAGEALRLAVRGSTTDREFWGQTLPVASPEFVYTLKMSHRYLKNSPSFLKTMDDIRLLRVRGRGEIVDQDFFKARESATYSYGHPKLNVDKSAFFTDDVPYTYDHDDIHVAVAVDGLPAYTKYIADGAQVMTSHQKFASLPRKVQLCGVLEESYVLALERAIIPHDVDPDKAFLMALSKVCTSITSGKFREFAWENYHAVRRMYDPIFVDKFRAALRAGNIKDYQGKAYA